MNRLKLKSKKSTTGSSSKNGDIRRMNELSLSNLQGKKHINCLNRDQVQVQLQTQSPSRANSPHSKKQIEGASAYENARWNALSKPQFEQQPQKNLSAHYEYEIEALQLQNQTQTEVTGKAEAEQIDKILLDYLAASVKDGHLSKFPQSQITDKSDKLNNTKSGAGELDSHATWTPLPPPRRLFYKGPRVPSNFPSQTEDVCCVTNCPLHTDNRHELKRKRDDESDSLELCSKRAVVDMGDNMDMPDASWERDCMSVVPTEKGEFFATNPPVKATDLRRSKGNVEMHERMSVNNSKRASSCLDDMDTANFVVVPESDEEDDFVCPSPPFKSSVVASGVSKASSRDDSGNRKINEGLQSCPLCQTEFSASMSSVDVDGHIAQCFQNSTDDVAW